MPANALYARLVDTSDRVYPNFVSPDERIIDVGPYPYVATCTRIMAGTTTGALILQHSAVKDSGAWVTLTSYSLNVSNCPGVPHYDAFENTLRYLRAMTTAGDVNTSISVDIIARL